MLSSLSILCFGTTLVLTHPQDLACFETNFPSVGTKSSTTYKSLIKNIQGIRIKQIYEELEVRNSTLSRNETLIKVELLKIFEGEKTILNISSHQFQDQNPRQIVLFYDGQRLQGAMAHYPVNQGVANWTCTSFNESAPKREFVLFSKTVDYINIPVNGSSVEEKLELEIIQNDESCFQESFPAHVESPVSVCDNKRVVDIKQSVGNNTVDNDIIVKEMRETLLEGQMKYVELTSKATDVLNPRYLIMLYDGLDIKAAINEIGQIYPTQSHCNVFNNSAPDTWYTTFGENITSQDPFTYIEDKLRVNFLDPMKPWGEEKDKECFDIQYPPCERVNTTHQNRTAIIFVTHYYSQHYQTTTEEAERFSVELTEGQTKVVKITSEFESDLENLEATASRNLSLLLEDNLLHVGMAQLLAWKHSSEWSCMNSSIVLEIGSEEDKTFMFSNNLQGSHRKDFLSFSWNSSSLFLSNNIFLYLFLLYVSITYI